MPHMEDDQGFADNSAANLQMSSIMREPTTQAEPDTSALAAAAQVHSMTRSHDCCCCNKLVDFAATELCLTRDTALGGAQRIWQSAGWHARHPGI
jgi:hypothetical protein